MYYWPYVRKKFEIQHRLNLNKNIGEIINETATGNSTRFLNKKRLLIFIYRYMILANIKILIWKQFFIMNNIQSKNSIIHKTHY